MVSAGFQMLGAALGILGWIGVIVVCAVPMWRVTAFIGSNIVTSQVIWEGIWMSCVVQSTGQMQCKVYDSMLALTGDLQGARALTIISIVVGVMAILLAVAGGRCTNSNTIIQEFYSPLLNAAQKREMGASLYIGWGASALMLIGGGLLCASCPKKEKVPHSARSISSNVDYV
uniref:Claudin b n=1 Tax=Neolamprologus brichardi TaxID=32507 RepID=A0A3Q4G1T8_NEOBR